MKKFILILMFMLIPFCFAGCSIAEFNSIFGFEQNKEEMQTAEEIQLENEMVSKLRILEQLSRNYNIDKQVTTNPVRRIMIYIRKINYDTTLWNALGGNIESDFEEYLIANQNENFVNELKDFAKNNYSIPTMQNREIDFVHMFAAMNLIYSDDSTLNQSCGDLGGWGGDMCQLVLTLKLNSSLEQTHDALKNASSNYLTSTEGGFNIYDLCADIDAFNIAKMISVSSESSDVLANAVYSYYSKNSERVIRTNFLNNCITSNYNTFSSLFTRLKNNLYISTWCNQNGISITDDAVYFEACCDAFLALLNR